MTDAPAAINSYSRDPGSVSPVTALFCNYFPLSLKIFLLDCTDLLYISKSGVQINRGCILMLSMPPYSVTFQFN